MKSCWCQAQEEEEEVEEVKSCWCQAQATPAIQRLREGNVELKSGLETMVSGELICSLDVLVSVMVR